MKIAGSNFYGVHFLFGSVRVFLSPKTSRGCIFNEAPFEELFRIYPNFYHEFPSGARDLHPRSFVFLSTGSVSSLRHFLMLFPIKSRECLLTRFTRMFINLLLSDKRSEWVSEAPVPFRMLICRCQGGEGGGANRFFFTKKGDVSTAVIRFTITLKTPSCGKLLRFFVIALLISRDRL